jgi:hypothetical protein
MESDVVVRCGAILLVLFHHGLGGVRGGTDILMMLAGFSWARFQRRRLIEGKSASVFMDFARRYLVIYLLITLGVGAQNGYVTLSHLVFVSTFLADRSGILNIYWFMETLTWCAALTCLVFSLPAVRRLNSDRPLGSALAFVALAVLVRLGGDALIDTHATLLRSPDQMLLYFAAGWAIALSTQLLRFGLFAMLCGVSGLAWGWSDSHVLAMACAGAVIVFVPRLALPALAARPVMIVAAASFYIYLFNIFPMYLTDHLLHEQNGRFWLLQVVLSLILGVIVYSVLERSGPLLVKARGAWALRRAPT